MLQRAVGFVLSLLVVFGLSLLLIPAIGMLIGVLNKVILNAV
jgi:preprotein translocase subunit Sss1